MSGAISGFGTRCGSSRWEPGRWKQVRVSTDDLGGVNQAVRTLKESTGSFKWLFSEEKTAA